MMYLAVIADLIDSRNIPDREPFQKNLEKCLREISSSPMILSPYTITLGDEFQALYSGARGLFRDLLQIMTCIHPCQIRIALGIGTLSTAINPETAIGMDGRAFYAARRGVEGMKKKKGNALRIHSDPEELPAILTSGLELISSLTAGWKFNTLLILRELLDRKSVREIAAVGGISERGAYKIISANNLKEICDMLFMIEDHLSEIVG